MNESVILSGIHNVNALGVLRGLAKQGVPVTLLDIDPHSMVRYSRFISQRLPCPNPSDSEAAFIQFLIDLGNRLDHKPVIIPTGDAEAIALSRHKDTLDPFFQIPICRAEIVDLLVNKKRFFQEMIRRAIPCPKSYFPETTSEARDIAAGIEYPFIIKAAYSHQFIKQFHKKVFVIHSFSEFETALELLHTARLEYFLQEVIPGNAFFLFYSYFNRQSLPLGICGYDKVRQFPKDFGIGTICRSIDRPQPTLKAVDFLKAIHYHGIAEPEFKLDPRDGQYKFIEVNTRSVTMTLLAKACGIHVEYIAYLDMIEGNIAPLGPASEGMLWIDEISELHYQLSRIRRGLFSFSELSVIFEGKKVFACAAIDDPIPFFVGLARFIYERCRSSRNVDTMLGI
jgi:predicted ATP-grasp superfamily ATP-dependent carboligase